MQYVGTCGTTLKKALEDIDKEFPDKVEVGNDKVIVYHDTYRGVTWEINHIERTYGQWWTYYILLNRNRMEPEQFELFNAPIETYELGGKKRKHYDYNKIPSIDLHGGCTFYNKDKNTSLEYFILKIGCDYHHIWDEEQSYQLEDIIADVKKSIDSFLSRYTYKRWCGNCGAIVNISDGKIKEPDEGAYAFKCKGCLKKTKS